jgi:hypothetical protein
MFKSLPFLYTLLFSFSGWCQSGPLIAPPGPLVVPIYSRIPLDSLHKQQMIQSLNGLLSQLSGANKDNAFVQPEYLPETSDLLDQIRGMGDPLPGRKESCRCYLTNVNQLDSTDYLVQFAYLSLQDTTPLLRASFKLVAHQAGDRYAFSSPLRRNTTGWKVRKVGDFTFYYTDYPFNESLLSAYVRKAQEFDRKLHAPSYQTVFYCCRSFEEALEALGCDYKLDYNGVSSENLSAFERQTSLHVLGGSGPAQFDHHDLWHDRLHAVVPVSTINRPIDEACAYLYGGSWGLSWEEVFRQFKTYMGDNRDWLTAFTENRNFAQPNQNHLYVSYVITALLVKKIEREKGFHAVLQFLTCGKYQRDNENYFQALNTIVGIDRSNFNSIIQELVDSEIKSVSLSS